MLNSHNAAVCRREERAAGRLPKWIEFNDHIVRKFDINNLADETFGGEEILKAVRASNNRCCSC